MEWNLLNIVAIGCLTAAVVADLRTRKIQNILSLTSLVLCTLAVIYVSSTQSTPHWTEPLKAFGLASVIALSLFAMKVWGGGDAKMFIAVSPLLLFAETPIYLLCCLVWGSVLGLTSALLNARMGAMISNLSVLLIHRKGVDQSHLVKVPFSVALLLGYLSLMTLRGLGAL